MITIEQDIATQTTCACGAPMTRITSPFAAVGLTRYSHAFLCAACSRVEFAPIDPYTSIIRVSGRPASAPCTNCHCPVIELPNPYYGIKRAVPSSIRFCTACDQA